MASRLNPPYTRQERFDWGEMDWLMSDLDRRAAGFSKAMMRISAGARGGAHRHSNASEHILVLTGDIDIRLKSVRIRLSAGEQHLIPLDVPHEIINVGQETAELVITYSHPDRRYEPVSWADLKTRVLRSHGDQARDED